MECKINSVGKETVEQSKKIDKSIRAVLEKGETSFDGMMNSKILKRDMTLMYIKKQKTERAEKKKQELLKKQKQTEEQKKRLQQLRITTNKLAKASVKPKVADNQQDKCYTRNITPQRLSPPQKSKVDQTWSPPRSISCAQKSVKTFGKTSSKAQNAETLQSNSHKVINQSCLQKYPVQREITKPEVFKNFNKLIETTLVEISKMDLLEKSVAKEKQNSGCSYQGPSAEQRPVEGDQFKTELKTKDPLTTKSAETLQSNWQNVINRPCLQKYPVQQEITKPEVFENITELIENTSVVVPKMDLLEKSVAKEKQNSSCSYREPSAEQSPVERDQFKPELKTIDPLTTKSAETLQSNWQNVINRPCLQKCKQKVNQKAMGDGKCINTKLGECPPFNFLSLLKNKMCQNEINETEFLDFLTKEKKEQFEKIKLEWLIKCPPINFFSLVKYKLRQKEIEETQLEPVIHSPNIDKHTEERQVKISPKKIGNKEKKNPEQYDQLTKNTATIINEDIKPILEGLNFGCTTSFESKGNLQKVDNSVLEHSVDSNIDTTFINASTTNISHVDKTIKEYHIQVFEQYIKQVKFSIQEHHNYLHLAEKRLSNHLISEITMCDLQMKVLENRPGQVKQTQLLKHERRSSVENLEHAISQVKLLSDKVKQQISMHEKQYQYLRMSGILPSKRVMREFKSLERCSLKIETALLKLNLLGPNAS